MTPARYNFDLRKGSSFSRQITWSSSGALVNLSGFTAAMQLKSAIGDSTAVLSLTDEDGITLGGAAGTIDIVITAAQAATLTAGVEYVYDIELYNGTSTYPILEGRIFVEGEITT